MATTFKGVTISEDLLIDLFGERIASKFENKSFEDLAAVDAWCAKTKGIGKKTQAGFHKLIVEVMKAHNNPKPKEQRQAPAPLPVEFKVPGILVKIGYLKAKDPSNQPLFEKLASALEREETDKLVRYRLKPEVYKTNRTQAYQFMGHIKNKMAAKGYKVGFGGGWLLIEKKR